MIFRSVGVIFIQEKQTRNPNLAMVSTKNLRETRCFLLEGGPPQISLFPTFLYSDSTTTLCPEI